MAEFSKRRKIFRKAAGVSFFGEVEIDMGKYRYRFPELEQLGQKLSLEDRKLIAKATGKTENMVWCVLSGTRWNEKVVELAVQFVQFNDEANKAKLEIVSA
jgi:hypothetical protein